MMAFQFASRAIPATIRKIMSIALPKVLIIVEFILHTEKCHQEADKASGYDYDIEYL